MALGQSAIADDFLRRCGGYHTRAGKASTEAA